MRKLVWGMLMVGVLCAVAAAEPKGNRAVVDRFFAVVDGKNVAKLAEVDAVDLDMVTPMGPVKGLEGHKQMIKGFATAFPDFKHTVTRCVENGDMISCEGTFAGTHNGTMTMPDGTQVKATK